MNSYSIWVKLDRLPPLLMRLMATHPQDRNLLMSDEMIVRRANTSDLRLEDVKRLSWLKSWDSVSIAQCRAFCAGCGIDFSDPIRMKNITRYLRNNPSWSHLKRDVRLPEYKQMLAQLFQQ